MFLRAEWSISKTLDRYIFAGSGSDQVVGRAVAGLPVYNSQFATLPPHFLAEGMERLRKIDPRKIISWYHKAPDSFKTVFPYLVASVVYHYEFLVEKLSPQHPLWQQRMFRCEIDVGEEGVFPCVYDALKELVRTGQFEDQEVGMKASGLPSHLILNEKLDRISEKMTALSERTERSIAALKELICSKSDQLPRALHDELLKHFNVEGVVPINMDDLKAAIRENNVLVIAELENLKTTLLDKVAQPDGGSSTSPCTEVVAEGQHGKYQCFSYGGKLNLKVPEGFKFPKGDVKTLWGLWFFGDSRLGIRPFRKLSAQDLEEKQCKVLFSKTKTIMNRMKKLCISKACPKIVMI